MVYGQDIVETSVWNVADKRTISDDTVGQTGTRPKEGKVWYWYSPDVKYIVKCQYEKTDYWDTINDWEVTSFKLKQ